MIKWEYRKVYATTDFDNEDFNFYGELGWELVCTHITSNSPTAKRYFIFKRKK